MSVTIQGNTSTVISNNSAPEGTSEIAKITRQIQVLTEKLGKISSEEGMTTVSASFKPSFASLSCFRY